MTLPFSESEFLDVFGSFNVALWPIVGLLWIVTAVLLIQWYRHGGQTRRLSTLLVIHWAWSGAAYHWLYFRRINPAAALFAGLFLVQAAVFLWTMTRPNVEYRQDGSFRSIVGSAFTVYALAYPFVGRYFGLDFPRIPIFAVPCPTVLLTTGLLLTTTGMPRSVNIIPIIWSVVGSSAAVLLGIRADLALVVAAAVLIVDTVLPRALGAR